MVWIREAIKRKMRCIEDFESCAVLQEWKRMFRIAENLNLNAFSPLSALICQR